MNKNIFPENYVNFEDAPVSERDNLPDQKQMAILEGAEHMDGSGNQEKFPKQYWVVFSDEDDPKKAYKLLQKSETKPLFGDNLLGYSFDNVNTKGIEINFRKTSRDLRQELDNFFRSHNLIPFKIHLPKNFENGNRVVRIDDKVKKSKFPKKEPGDFEKAA